MATVLITGTSSGLGLGAAVELARRGERVFASMRNPARSQGLERAAAAAGVEVEVVQLDVTDPESVSRAVADVLDAAGRIDVLVNNAAVAINGPLEFSTDEQVSAVFETNAIGPIRLIRAVLPAMREQRASRIVNVSSLVAQPRTWLRTWSIYGASKAALHHLTIDLTKELMPFGIRTVLVEGGISGNTEIWRDLDARLATLNPTASPYEVGEQFNLANMALSLERHGVDSYDASNERALHAVQIIADAATMADPPLRFPPQEQALSDACARIGDTEFLELSRIADADEAQRRWEEAFGGPAS